MAPIVQYNTNYYNFTNTKAHICLSFILFKINKFLRKVDE